MSEANVWEPRTLAEVSADTKRVSERLTGTVGQTLFTLKSFAYTVGTGALQIYRQGTDVSVPGTRALIPGVEFIEQTSTSFSVVTGAIAGEQFLAVGYVGIEGTLDVRETDIYVANYAAIRAYAGTEVTLYAQGAASIGDTGEGFFAYITGAAVGYYVDDNESILVPTGGDGSAAWVREPYLAATRFPNVTANVGASNTELDILDGALVTTAELNILDGATADATELNILDGATLTTAQLNYLAGVVAGTVAANKAVVADGSNAVDALTVTLLGAASVLADGVTATTKALGTNTQEVATMAAVEAQAAKVYTSSWYTITSAALVSGAALAHGLGAVPHILQHELKCIAAGGSAGYAQNDIIIGPTNENGASQNAMATVDATNLTVRYGSDATVFHVLNKTTGTGVDVPNTDWNYRIRAIYLP